MTVLESGAHGQSSPRTSRRYIQESGSPALDRKDCLHLGQIVGVLADRKAMSTYRRASVYRQIVLQPAQGESVFGAKRIVGPQNSMAQPLMRLGRAQA